MNYFFIEKFLFLWYSMYRIGDDSNNEKIVDKLAKVTKRDIILSIVISIILVLIWMTFTYFTWQSNNNSLVDITVEDIADVVFKGGNDLKVTDIVPVLDYNDGEIIANTLEKENR